MWNFIIQNLPQEVIATGIVTALLWRKFGTKMPGFKGSTKNAMTRDGFPGGH